jgi:acyl-ACP thioesterase
MGNIHTENYHVRYSDTGRNNALKVRSFFEIFQEAAANHAEILGVGRIGLTAQSLMWVLSRLKVNFLEYPSAQEDLVIDTYPSLANKLTAQREFILKNSAGKVVAKASSLWLLLDSSNLRPCRIERVVDLLPDTSNLEVFFSFDDKAEKSTIEEFSQLIEIPVSYSMEDVNQHMNNAQYAALVQDLISWEVASPVKLSYLDISFSSAVASPQTLKVGVISQGDSWKVAGFNNDGRLSFVAKAQVML